MCTSCPTSPDISARGWKLPHFCGDTISVRTLCTSQVFLTVNMKTIWSCVTERVYCAYLLASCKHILSTLVDSLYVHAHVLLGGISPPSGSKAFLRVRNTTVCNFYIVPRVGHIIGSVLFIQFRSQSSYRGSRSKLQSRNGSTPKPLARPFSRILKVRPGPSHLAQCRTSSCCFRAMPESSGSKRSRYSLRKVRTSV